MVMKSKSELLVATKIKSEMKLEWESDSKSELETKTKTGMKLEYEMMFGSMTESELDVSYTELEV